MATNMPVHQPPVGETNNQDEENSNLQYYTGNFDRLCRLCLSSDQLVSIFSKVQGRNVYYMRNFMKHALNLLSAKINIHDKLPQFVCERCELSLYVIFNFKQKCDKSLAILQRVRDSIIKKSGKVDPEDVKKEPKVQGGRKRKPVSKQLSCEEILKKLPAAINVEKLDVSSVEKSVIELDSSGGTAIRTNEPVDSIKTGMEETHALDGVLHVQGTRRDQSEEQVEPTEIETFASKSDDLVVELLEELNDGLESEKASPAERRRPICSICGEMVNNDNSYMDSHNDALPYHCHQCLKRFVTCSKIKNYANNMHLRKHSVEPDVSRESAEEINEPIDSVKTRTEETHGLDEVFQVQDHKQEASKRRHSEEQMDPTECLEEEIAFAASECEGLDVELREIAEDELNTEKRMSNGLRSDGDELEAEKNKSNGRRPTACPIFREMVNGFKSHMISHSDVLPYQCDQCPKRFLTRGKMKKHNNNVHVRRHAVKCDRCEKTFGGPKHLQSHINSVHLRKRDFICDVCRKAFLDKCNLSTHMRIHNGERNFKCDICAKTFLFATTLRYHMLIHTQEKKHECNFCGKLFLLRSTLRRHLNIHADLRPHACDLCDKKFRTTTERDVHVRTHTGEKPLTCYICEMLFANHKARSVHMKLVHLDELERLGLIDDKGHLKRH